MAKKAKKTKKKAKARPTKKRKTAARKPVAKKPAAKKTKPIGVVTHYYGEISVAVIKFNKPFKAGGKVHFKGATTDFKDKIKSMQYDHKPAAAAKKGKQVGAKVSKKVRQGDYVYEAD